MNVVAPPREDPQPDALPQPAAFEIDPSQSDRLREELLASYGGKRSWPLYLVQFATFAAQPALRFSSHGFSDVEGRVMLAILFSYVVLFVFVWRGRFAATAIARSGYGATIDFEESGLGIIGKSRAGVMPRRFVPLAKIRSVRLLTDAILVSGTFGPIVIIPNSALPDGGSAIARYFEARLVGRRLLRRPVPRSHAIVNTRYP
jgi:hypothetical protein